MSRQTQELNAIGRDPFGRQDVVERPAGEGECRNCGCDTDLYEYGVQPDSISGRVNWFAGRFCDAGCWCSFHNADALARAAGLLLDEALSLPDPFDTY